MHDYLIPLDHFPTLLRIALDLFRRPNPSGREDLMRAYVVAHLEQHQFTVSVDEAGNVLATRGVPDPAQGYPLLSFHLDSVGQEATSSAEDDILASVMARRSRTHRRATSLAHRPLMIRSAEELALTNGWLHSRECFVLGGDDKCGAAIALTLAALTDAPLKIVASVQEEIGCIGIEQVDPSFFVDVAYALVLDRRGANHLVVSIGGQTLCQGAFAAAMMRAAADVGLIVYVVEGALSDARTLATHILNVVNVSVGYAYPHSARERVSLSDLWHSYQWIHEALGSLPRACPTHHLDPFAASRPDAERKQALLCPHCGNVRIELSTMPEDYGDFLCRCCH